MPKTLLLFLKQKTWMIGTKKRFEVLKRDNFRCQYCWRTWKDVTLEIDHIIPQAKWWTDEFDNLITCCRECNMWKWDEDLNSRNSVFKVKCKDLYEHIKKNFYSHRNEEIKTHGEYNNKKINGTLDMNTMWLLASFLQRWLDERLKNPNKIKELIEEWVDTIKRIEEHEDMWGRSEQYYNKHPILKSIKDNPSSIEEKVQEFYEGWELFDEITDDFDWDFIADDCYFRRVFYDDIWKTDDMNARLNYTITSNINEYSEEHGEVPRRIIEKYSLYPNAKL